MSLLDPFNPAGGIKVAYHGGNTCGKAAEDTAETVDICSAMLGAKDKTEAYCARSLTLNIKCRNEINTIPNTTEVIFVQFIFIITVRLIINFLISP